MNTQEHTSLANGNRVWARMSVEKYFPLFHEVLRLKICLTVDLEGPNWDKEKAKANKMIIISQFYSITGLIFPLEKFMTKCTHEKTEHCTAIITFLHAQPIVLQGATPITVFATVVTAITAAAIKGHNGCSLSKIDSNKHLPQNSTDPKEKQTDVGSVSPTYLNNYVYTVELGEIRRSPNDY